MNLLRSYDLKTLLATVCCLLMIQALLGQDYPMISYSALPYLGDSSTTRQHDTNSFVSNYDFAVDHYNQAVEIIENVECDISMDALYDAQERAIKQFAEALPYAKTANRLEPGHRETLTMLSGIYFALNDIEKCEQYQADLDKVDPPVKPASTNEVPSVHPVH